MTEHRHARDPFTTGTKTQKASLVVGATFLLVGGLGFVPGFTIGYDHLEFAGGSGAMLLSVFAVSVLHNLIHLSFGVAGLLLARTWSDARGYLVGGGVLYLLLWLYGPLVGNRNNAELASLTDANNWLHLVLGFGMFSVGVFFSGERRSGGLSGVPLRRTAPPTELSAH